MKHGKFFSAKKLRCPADIKFRILLLALVCLVSFSGIVAYLTTKDKVKNAITIGSNEISIEENFTPPQELKPGITFDKNVWVKNVGPCDCYVRIKAVFSTSDMEKLCEVDWNDAAIGGDWIYNAEDNYWYYPFSITTKEKTPSLFTQVSIKDKYDFDGDGVIEDDETVPASIIQDFDIIVYAESYQSGEYDHYLDAWAHYQANKPK